MPAVAPVGIHDDLAARQTRVSHGTTGNEAARRIDVNFRGLIEHFSGDHWLDDFLDHGFAQIAIGNFVAMLRRNHHGIDSNRAAVGILDGNLGFGVGAEEIHFVLLADLSDFMSELVSKLNGHGHQLGCFIARVAEHHALVSGAAGINAHGDVWRLAFHGGHHAAGLGVKAVLSAVVANFVDHLADNRLVIEDAGRIPS